MIKSLTIAGVIVASSLSFVAFAQAEDFPAAPMNAGPPDLTGTVTKLATGGSSMQAQPMMEKPMMHKHMMHHRMSKKMMMKKKMMMHKKEM